MVLWLKAEFPVYRLLCPLDGIISEFHDGAAVHADEVIVMLVPIGVLIVARPLVAAGRAGESRLLEESKCAEDRGLADARVHAADSREKVFRGHMLLDPEKNLEDSTTRPGHLKAVFAEVTFEQGNHLFQLTGSLIHFDVDYQYHLIRRLSTALDRWDTRKAQDRREQDSAWAANRQDEVKHARAGAWNDGGPKATIAWS